eukprot:142185_1
MSNFLYHSIDHPPLYEPNLSLANHYQVFQCKQHVLDIVTNIVKTVFIGTIISHTGIPTVLINLIFIYLNEKETWKNAFVNRNDLDLLCNKSWVIKADSTKEISCTNGNVIICPLKQKRIKWILQVRDITDYGAFKRFNTLGFGLKVMNSRTQAISVGLYARPTSIAKLNYGGCFLSFVVDFEEDIMQLKIMRKNYSQFKVIGSSSNLQHNLSQLDEYKPNDTFYQLAIIMAGEKGNWYIIIIIIYCNT